MNNVVQLPYQYNGEPQQDYRDRRDTWRKTRGWITKPVPVPPVGDRRRIERQQSRSSTPLFDIATRTA